MFGWLDSNLGFRQAINYPWESGPIGCSAASGFQGSRPPLHRQRGCKTFQPLTAQAWLLLIINPIRIYNKKT